MVVPLNGDTLPSVIVRGARRPQPKGPRAHRGEFEISGTCARGKHLDNCHKATCACPCHRSGH